MEELKAGLYRGVTARVGGPVARFERARLEVLKRRFHHVNAYLDDDLMERSGCVVTGPADGSGTHPALTVARRIAVSKALERWTYQKRVNSPEAHRYAFDVDPTTNGIAAFPGQLADLARRAARLEAWERFSLLAWWEGLAEARWVESDWETIEAFAIEGPWGGLIVVVMSGPGEGGWAYGYAGGASFSEAFDRAVIGLTINRAKLSFRHKVKGAEGVGVSALDRRLLYFASDAGSEQVRSRVAASAGRRMPKPAFACDCEISGPWSRYATVWRAVLFPPGKAFSDKNRDAFFF